MNLPAPPIPAISAPSTVSGAPVPAGPALVLTGGGARAAYQAGVLSAIAGMARDCAVPGEARPSPFSVIAGTSAGAINAAALACQADDFQAATDRLEAIWSNFHSGQVYRSDSLGIAMTGARWLATFTLGWALPRLRLTRPQSLLDNAPLGDLLAAALPIDRLDALIESGCLSALAVTASSYSSGEHVTFYQSRDPIRPWTRSQRIAVRQSIGIGHLLASAAIPFVFPAVATELRGRRHWFGDGSMRMIAPLAPAIHLGADRVLVIGCGSVAGEAERLDGDVDGPPSLARIGGHALSGIFTDALSTDLERLQRINRTLALMDPVTRRRTGLRPVEVLAIEPSRSIGELASQSIGALPVPVRVMLRAVGVGGRAADARGTALASYLLFESAFTRELIALGRHDALARRDALIDFFGWQPISPR